MEEDVKIVIKSDGKSLAVFIDGKQVKHISKINFSAEKGKTILDYEVNIEDKETKCTESKNIHSEIRW